jgi:hypothetical protein
MLTFCSCGPLTPLSQRNQADHLEVAATREVAAFAERGVDRVVNGGELLPGLVTLEPVNSPSTKWLM